MNILALVASILFEFEERILGARGWIADLHVYPSSSSHYRGPVFVKRQFESEDVGEILLNRGWKRCWNR